MDDDDGRRRAEDFHQRYTTGDPSEGYDAQEAAVGPADRVTRRLDRPLPAVPADEHRGGPADGPLTALQDAASVASLLITTEAMVAELPKKNQPAMPAMPGGGGMDF